LTGKRWPVIGKRIHEEFPYIEAEISYAVKEYARTAIDVLARRTRLSFLNVVAADEALPTIIQIMASELNWNEQKQKVRRMISIRHASRFLFFIFRKKWNAQKRFYYEKWASI